MNLKKFFQAIYDLHCEGELDLFLNEIDEKEELDPLTKPVHKLYKNAYNASIIGDTIGDPMKDTSGPSLNILIKLSSIISVVFGAWFVQTSLLIK